MWRYNEFAFQYIILGLITKYQQFIQLYFFILISDLPQSLTHWLERNNLLLYEGKAVKVASNVFSYFYHWAAQFYTHIHNVYNYTNGLDGEAHATESGDCPLIVQRPLGRTAKPLTVCHFSMPNPACHAADKWLDCHCDLSASFQQKATAGTLSICQVLLSEYSTVHVQPGLYLP